MVGRAQKGLGVAPRLNYRGALRRPCSNPAQTAQNHPHARRAGASGVNALGLAVSVPAQWTSCSHAQHWQGNRLSRRRAVSRRNTVGALRLHPREPPSLLSSPHPTPQVWRNHAALVEALLEAGADPDAQDAESGWSALHRALHWGQLRIAAALLAANASPGLHDWRGRTPLDLLSAELKEFLEGEVLDGDVFAWGAVPFFQRCLQLLQAAPACATSCASWTSAACSVLAAANCSVGLQPRARQAGEQPAAAAS